MRLVADEQHAVLRASVQLRRARLADRCPARAPASRRSEPPGRAPRRPPRPSGAPADRETSGRARSRARAPPAPGHAVGLPVPSAVKRPVLVPPGSRPVLRLGVPQQPDFHARSVAFSSASIHPNPKSFYPSPAMALSAGEQLGPYEIVGPLGKGGMGEVYRARDNRLRREVALKMLPDAARQRRRQPRALRPRDARRRRAESSEHPRDPRHGHAPGVPYAVTELLEGETLADRLRTGPLAAAARDRDRLPDRRRPRRRARQGSHPPRHQAREHLPDATRGAPRSSTSASRASRSPPTLSPVPREPELELRVARGHGRLHVARAGPRKEGRRAQRHLLARRASSTRC